MLKLHEHNKNTYERLTRLFTVHSRAACVQPTGTGKSFIILKLVEDNPDKRFIIAASSAYIFGQIRTHSEKEGMEIENVAFITYTKLAQLDRAEIEALECDYIVLDEFHRCGAAEWGEGINTLLETHKGSRVLGTSATPIRYLDNARNMAEEIFGNVYAVNMSLVEAIEMNILPLPIYVTAVYSFAGDVERLRIRAEKTKNPKLKMLLLGKIRQAKRMLTEMSCGIEDIFKKHIPNRNGKYIIFCPGVEKLKNITDECDEWFREVNKNIHKYSVYFENYSSEKEFEEFKNDNDKNSLKLLFCVNMLNEGVHIEGVEGVIMLRATRSANIFYQQLGRALVCGSKNIKHPVIFDIVNNYETGGDAADTYSQIMMLSRENGKSLYGSIEFELYDYVHDVRTILNDLYSTFGKEWDVVFELVKEYVEKNNKFPLYFEKSEGIQLGMWCSTQRGLYHKNKLSDYRIEKLNSIGFKWENRDDLWNEKYEMLKEYIKIYGRLPRRTDNDENAKYLANWIQQLKGSYKNNLISAEKSEKLMELGVKLTKEKTVTYADWNTMFEELLEFVEKYKRFPDDQDKNGENKRLYSWTVSQRGAKKKNTLSPERFKKLEGIGFVWDRIQEQWNNMFSLVKMYIEENGKPPSRHVKVDGTLAGQWFIKQVKAYKSGEIDDYRKKKLESLGIPIMQEKDAKPERFWNTCFDELKKYIDDKKSLPFATEEFEGTNLYNWLISQKMLSKKGMLNKDKRSRLLSLGIDIDKFAVKNEGGLKKWMLSYNSYMEFIEKNGRKPERVLKSNQPEERKLYDWMVKQKRDLKKGILSEDKRKMLINAGVVFE